MRWRSDPDGDRFFALRTFRRDGSGVCTPVWLAADGDRLLGFTPARSGKVARIRRHADVEIARSDGEGRPYEPFRPARARILADADRDTVISALTARYGIAFRTFRVVVRLARRGRGVGFEVVGR